MIGLFVKGGTAILTKLIISLASERMIEWSFFKVAEAVTKSTATPHDDEWLSKLREEYQR